MWKNNQKMLCWKLSESELDRGKGVREVWGIKEKGSSYIVGDGDEDRFNEFRGTGFYTITESTFNHGEACFNFTSFTYMIR